MLACSRDVPPDSRSPSKRWQEPRYCRLTTSLEKAVVAGQPLQEFSRGCQGTLGLEAQVHHTCGRASSPKPRGGQGSRWEPPRKLTDEGRRIMEVSQFKATSLGHPPDTKHIGEAGRNGMGMWQ